MQKIFYNARFLTMNEKFDESQAMLVNNDSIVFVGDKDEVLQLKNEETELIDLKHKFVIPTFFDLNLSIYTIIENNLKTANKDKFIEKNRKNDEDYEEFFNFDIYRTEFLKLQLELLKLGLTTIQEHISSKEEFIFWKKISERGDLKIDIIGYIDFVKNKQIMDDNCRSFRKYKNHFRLGGYYVNIDGLLIEKRAWLKKAYPKEKKYSGFSEIGYEQLSFIIKTVLEEKKQLLVHANGDMAVDLFTKCYEEYIQNNKVEDNYRPIVIGCNFVTMKTLKKFKKLNLIGNFDINNLIENNKKLKSYFGIFKLRKMLHTSELLKNDVDFLLYNSNLKYFNTINIMQMFQNKGFRKKLYMKNLSDFDIQFIIKMLTLKSAYYCFDLDQKGSLESGKKANFLVLNTDILSLNISDKDVKIESVYLEGEKI